MLHFDSLEPRRLFAGGTLDSSFGVQGTAVLRYPDVGASENFDSTRPVKLLSDAAGRTLVIAEGGKHLTITRLTAAGALDAGYGTTATNNGFVLDGFAGYDVDAAPDAAGRLDLLADGALRRITARGRLDRTFGQDGVFSFTAAGYRGRRLVRVADIDTDPQGRLWGVGLAYDRRGRMAVGALTIAFRLSADGTLDRTFGENGVLPLSTDRFGPAGYPGDSSVRVLPTGSTVVALAASDSLISFKFESDGALDPAYGTRGRAINTTDNGVGDLDVIRIDGRIDSTLSVADSDLKAGFNYPAGENYNGDVEVAADGRSIYTAAFRNNSLQPLGLDPLAQAADGSKWIFDDPAAPPVGLAEDYGLLYHVNADGTLDRRFNHGMRLDAAVATATGGGEIVVAIQTGGEDASPATDRITVARYRTEDAG